MLSRITTLCLLLQGLKLGLETKIGKEKKGRKGKKRTTNYLSLSNAATRVDKERKPTCHLCEINIIVTTLVAASKEPQRVNELR